MKLKMKGARPIILLVTAALLAWAAVTPVQAHAMLVRSIPDANASLASSPAQVELFFSEAVANKLSKISVMDASGKRLDGGDARVDPADATHLLVSLGSLGDGVYMVAWAAVSATDGHQTSGSFPFAVGKVDASAMAMVGSQAATPSPPAPLGDMILKGFLYLAAAALMGAILFTFLVWDPARREAQVPAEDVHAYRRIFHNLALAALVVLAAADVLSLMVQAGQASGALIGWPWQPEFLALLSGSRVGLLGIIRLLLAAALAGLLLPPQNKWNRWAGLAACLLLLLTFSLESHAASDPRPLLPVLADWVHMTAVSVWVGGLYSFLGGMWLIRMLAPEPRTRFTSTLIPHFTVLAMSSVGALTLTGIYASILRIGALDALWSTPYGKALLLKLFIAAPMLAMGAINFLFTTPSMRRAAARPGGSPGLVTRFRRLLASEAALGCVILIWVGVFTTLPPVKVASMPAGFNQTTRADDLTITLTIDPARPGINTFTAAITSGGKPAAGINDVSLEFTSVSNMVPASKAAMASQGDGKTYRLQGGYLAMPDKWDIKVVVLRTGKFDAYGDFKIDLGPPAGQMAP